MRSFKRVYCDLDGVIFHTQDLIDTAFQTAIDEVTTFLWSIPTVHDVVYGKSRADIAAYLENEGCLSSEIEKVFKRKDTIFWDLWRKKNSVSHNSGEPLRVNFPLVEDLLSGIGDPSGGWVVEWVTAGSRENAEFKLLHIEIPTRGYFIPLFCSANKRTPEFWAECAGKTDYPRQTLVIDDDLLVLDAARSLGFSTLHTVFEGMLTW